MRPFRPVTRSRKCLALAVIVGCLTVHPVSGQVGRSVGVLDANVAQGRDLLAVPGLTPELVRAILEARPFMSMSEFDGFLSRSIDRDQRSFLYQRLFLPININSSSDDELRLVPGMGARMLLEVRENKPFESLDAFNQEIGKYVSPKELANLAQYLFVPLDVNEASDVDLNTIPGMTPKLLSTIKKHRPYDNAAAFIKTIRKVVSSREAARLSAFVRIGPSTP